MNPVEVTAMFSSRLLSARKVFLWWARVERVGIYVADYIRNAVDSSAFVCV